MFDFQNYADNSEAQRLGREIELLDPAGRKTGVFFTVHGVESPQYREGARALAERLSDERRLREDSIEDRLQDQALQLSHCVSAWRTGDDPVVVLSGEKLAFSRENVMKILMLSALIRAQVYDAVNRAAGFTKG